MKIWQSRTIITWLLAPFSLLFWLVSQFRRWLYCKKIFSSYRSPVPVLIVGNISVGGNGKTPVVVWLVEQLQQRGIKVGVISRGYGGKNKQFPQLITPESDPELMGDEPVLIAQRTKAPVAISPNRQQSIELLLSHFSLDLIIADDGLQHYALDRDIEWVVIDGERLFGNGFVLPAGGLRELPSRLQSVQAVICNGKSANVANEHLMQLLPDNAINLKTGQAKPLVDFTAQKVVALAGIGYPPRFFSMLENYGISLYQQHSFADHQSYTKEMLDPLSMGGIPLLMTEKDAVKCTEFAQENWWCVPVSAKFSEQSTACLLEPILNLVRK
ncbi:tetraacyldisaccharide 4'-kinase [Vespertiliibacter pulmonis]|uniref:Tetraacyldisaccharide 4'-kinase n=1 Tax=Vespertiliibacter pulmonis TaxID=1443036 RepID=A0A3N4VH24_9PAST|nr:tetraacyldisaccharide 4'-kinase [Vespertiliibacter pulmonis]QLB20499.1 tetraacyldisaccharide 4'-kinase [Vespertiliibacter pulmonis]RPE80805.1 lipid-A-disaccharide kinase [Vespertiliibacter pulmonis]